MSGHVAGMMLLASVCARGDRILVLDSRVGGYDGYMPEYMPEMLGLRVDVLPFDESEWTIDARAAADAIVTGKPKIVLIGGSFIVFPHNLRALRKACDEAGPPPRYRGGHGPRAIPAGPCQAPPPAGAPGAPA